MLLGNKKGDRIEFRTFFGELVKNSTLVRGGKKKFVKELLKNGVLGVVRRTMVGILVFRNFLRLKFNAFKLSQNTSKDCVI